MRCFFRLHSWHHYIRHDSPFRRCTGCERTEKAVTDYTDGATYWRLSAVGGLKG